MRSFWQVFLLILLAAGALYAQEQGRVQARVPVPGTVMPVPLPQPYGERHPVAGCAFNSRFADSDYTDDGDAGSAKTRRPRRTAPDAVREVLRDRPLRGD